MNLHLGKLVMNAIKFFTEIEITEQCNIWIERKIKQKVRAKYPENSDKANHYFKKLMLDGAEIEKLQSQFYS